MEQRVINHINSHLGSDVENISKSKMLVEKYANDIDVIKSKISYNDNMSPTLKLALSLGDHTSEKIKQTVTSLNKFNENITGKIDNYEIVLDGVQEKLNKIKNFYNLAGYLKLIQISQDISKEMSASLSAKDKMKTLQLYSVLYDLKTDNYKLGEFQNALYLQKYTTDTTVYWYEILRDKYSSEFDSTLKSIKWPYFNHSMEVLQPPKDSLTKLSSVAESLFRLKNPTISKDYIKITSCIVAPPLSIPIQVLIRPFRQRFYYHFSGTRQTNRLDKPEWYLTQILSWIRDNQLVVGKYFQTAAIDAERNDINARLEFICGLILIAVEKLCIDIEDICKDDTLFAHLVDEVLFFEQELKELAEIKYMSEFPTTVTVLTQPQYFTQWLTIESRCILSGNKLDEILSSSSAWDIIDPGSNEDLKIPKCADQFVRLLDAIKDRYSSLPQPGHQLEFLDLQIELIQDFTVEISQSMISKSLLLNAINYLNSVLREWGENVHYLHLHVAKVGLADNEISTVFDNSVKHLENLQRKFIKELASTVFDDIRAKSMAYRHDNWVSMLEQNKKEPFMLSVTASEMFQVMVKNLHDLESELSMNIFLAILRLVAHQMDDFFIDSMIMNSKFSAGGAAQFQFDMIRNLFALFGQYLRRPELLFKKVHNACLLLNLPTGSAMLLHQTIKNDSNMEKTANALKEVGVTNLPTAIAIDILERRVDVCI